MSSWKSIVSPVPNLKLHIINFQATKVKLTTKESIFILIYQQLKIKDVVKLQDILKPISKPPPHSKFLKKAGEYFYVESDNMPV